MDELWNNTKALNVWVNWLVGFSLAGVLIGVVHYVVHLPAFSVRTLEIVAAPQRAEAGDIAAAARGAVYGNFFTTDLNEVSKAFEQVPWVRRASVRRGFPWKLEVELEEQTALARWESGELVNTHGEVFAGQVNAALPQFSGQPESAAEMTQMYRAFSEKLQTIGLSIAEINLSPRRAWQLRLDNGMVLELGREQVEARLARFVGVYPYSLAKLSTQARYVDLRYHDGFAAALPGGGAL